MYIWKSSSCVTVNFLITRLHSSRMRTARVLTVSPSMLCTGGCTWSLGGVPGPGGVYLLWGVYLVPGQCTWSQGSVPGPRGVYLVPGGCIWSRGGVPGPGGAPVPTGCTWSWGGVPGPRGGGSVCSGGVPGPRGWGVSGTPPCEQNDKQVQKYYLTPNFVCGR